MSDGISDIARDEKRGEYFSIYLDKLKEYLKHPSKKSRDSTIEAAKNTDSVARGYHGGKTNIQEGLEEKMDLLSKNDKREWSRLLYAISDQSQYKGFRDISPFKDCLAIEVDYGSGSMHIEVSGLKDAVSDLLHKKDYKTYDCDKYLITIPVGNLELLLEKSDITWLRSGVYGRKTPRNSKGEARGL